MNRGARRLDPVSQLFVSAAKYSMSPRHNGPELERAAQDWMQAFPDEREGALFHLADAAKDVMQVIPLERQENARAIGIALTRALAEHRRRLAAAALVPVPTRWDERADLA